VSGDLSIPAESVVVQPPLPSPLKAITMNGARVESAGTDRVLLTALPADVVLEY
jgi:hypothetical protein